MADYDVVVIGAGNGGLTSALTLARRGRRVLLLERHNIPGGCATTFIRGRFEFEVALHQLSGLGTETKPGPLRSLLAELKVLDKLDWVEMPNLYRIVVPGELDLTLKANRLEITAALKGRFPGEAGAIDEFINLVWEFCNQWVCTMVLGDPESSPAKYPLYFHYALKSSEEVLEQFFKDPYLKAALSVYWAYMGLPPKFLSFSDMALLIWVYAEFKPYHMKGGSQALSNALLNNYLEAGGEVRFNCGAEKILVKNGKVSGVITEEGDEIQADDIVSNVSPLVTYLDLMDPDQVPAGVMKPFSSSTIGTSACTLYMGLDCEPETLNIHETTNFICREIDPQRAYDLSKTLSRPKASLLTCYDVDDPEFSPPGACQASLAALSYLEPWLSVPPAQYAETKYRFAQGLLDLAETAFPGITGHIEEMEISTPLTHMRYLGHPGGAIYGFEQHAKDSNLYMSPKSPLQGLYFAGAWVGAGGFQPTLESGVAAARSILKSKRWEAKP